LVLSGINAEEELDEETLVSLILIHEKSLGEDSHWSEFFKTLHQVNDPVVAEINK
jgi:hypothetical protein